MNCPSCGKDNDDNWPLYIDGEIRDDGCQECWESECDKSWWKCVDVIQGSNYDPKP